MNLNATLIGQMITFIFFIWFTMRYVWPPLMKAMDERRQTIADGLAAAAKAERDLELAAVKADEMIAEAKAESATLIDQANQRASRIVEDSKESARVEGERLLKLAQAEVEQAYHVARESLITEVAGLAVRGAEKLLHANIDDKKDGTLINELIGEV